MSEDDPDGPENSSQNSTQRTLTIDEKDAIFLKCTHTDSKGNPFGLGTLTEMVCKGKRKESYASSPADSLSEIHEQLEASRLKILAQEESIARRDEEIRRDQARRDEEHRRDQERIAEMERLITFSDPRLAAFMSEQPDNTPISEPVTASTTAQPPGRVTTSPT
ncbi:unnamed protein product [Arabis nemorensis]|uniref:Uncharacterized protein n=1 Tax=Arabis nemorensis TaxID=586526 RepID=A0A565BKL3_9BRAS|nr:unnamed protein product [Arabis nemorensis]